MNELFGIPMGVLAVALPAAFGGSALVGDGDVPKDRPDGLRYVDSLVYPATPALWG